VGRGAEATVTWRQPLAPTGPIRMPPGCVGGHPTDCGVRPPRQRSSLGELKQPAAHPPAAGWGRYWERRLEIERWGGDLPTRASGGVLQPPQHREKTPTHAKCGQAALSSGCTATGSVRLRRGVGAPADSPSFAVWAKSSY
jgi:hypothetical protein